MLTLKQNEFCKLIASGMSALESYAVAYKNNSQGTCKVNGSKLLKSDLIQEKIKEFQEINKQITNKAIEKVSDKLAKEDFADIAERKRVLTQIVRGEIPLKKAMVVNGAIELIEVVPDWMDRRNAIAELNKMDGDYAPIKQDTKITSNAPIIINWSEEK